MHFLKNYLKYLFVFILFTGVFSVGAQSVKELESQRKLTLKNLESTSKMLNETKKSQRSSLNKLTIINKNIKVRKQLISSINTEISALDSEMDKLNTEKQNLENRLKTLKVDYARLVQEAHINRSLYSKVMFIMSATSFDQSYRRLRYLQEYTNYRKQQVGEIERVTTEIAIKTETLQDHKSTKVDVIKVKETEAQKLSKDEKTEKGLLTDLQKKEKTLRANLAIQQKKANDLNKKIEWIIAEEIRKAEAKRLAEEKKRQEEEDNQLAKEGKPKSSSKSTTTSSSSRSAVSALTKEETLLSGNFERNKGRLPWPTSNGFISGRYGVQAHPVLTHVTTNNKGIYIQTPVGSAARAVFDGVVTQRFSIPGSNNAIIIQHGNFRTVYANLTQITVNVGDKVKAKETLGRIFTDDEKDNKTELYFQVWNGKVLQNPESWIAK